MTALVVAGRELRGAFSLPIAYVVVAAFLVLSGSGEIRLRKLFTDEVVTFGVTGADPAIVDMPTFWVHSITNTGDEPLVTLFFADELYDPANPDTYPEDV